MQRRLLQTAIALTGLSAVGFRPAGVLVGLLGELTVVPAIWLWQRHVAKSGLVR